MEKAIFSITCTTCHAKLAVRSEAAIGAVLECPKCASMVHVMPPEGWTSTPPTSDNASPPVVLPPLDRVNVDSLSLELEPSDVTWFGALVGRWQIIAAAAVAIVLVGWGLWWLAASPPTSDRNYSAEKREKTAIPTTKTERPPAEPKHPTPGTVEELAAETPSSVSSQPQEILPPTEDTKSASEKTKTPSLATPSHPPVKTKPAKPNPFRRLLDEADRVAKEAIAPKEIKRSPPIQVDVAARWAVPLHGIELTDMPLTKVLKLFSTISAVPITLDADAMDRAGIGPRKKLSLRLGESTTGDALQAAVAECGLIVVVDAGQAIVTSPTEQRTALRKIPYTVSDLTGDDLGAVEQLASLVERFVAPESWQAAGGQGVIAPDVGAITLEQTDDVHRQMLVFCERLRLARRKPLRSHKNPEQFTLVTKQDQAQALLDRPVTATFLEPAPLDSILTTLAESAHCTILIDRTALAAAETSDRVESTLSAVKQPLGNTLTSLLRPLGLTCRAINANVLQVTSKEAADDRMDVEFYPIGPWLAGGISGDELAEVLKSRVAPDSWNDAGGLADACFDPESRSLIVLQSQPVQAVIEHLLAVGPSR